MNFKTTRNRFLLLWLCCITLFAFLVWIEPKTGQYYGNYIGIIIFLGIVFFWVALVSEAVRNDKETNIRKLRVKFIIGLSALPIAGIVAFLIYKTQGGEYLSRLPRQKNNTQDLVDCYIDGMPVKATKANCAELSKRTTQTPTYQPTAPIITQQPVDTNSMVDCDAGKCGHIQLKEDVCSASICCEYGKDKYKLVYSQESCDVLLEKSEYRYTELVLSDRRFNCRADQVDSISSLASKTESAKERLDDCTKEADGIYSSCTESCASKKYNYCSTQRALWYSFGEDYTKLRNDYCYLK